MGIAHSIVSLVFVLPLAVEAKKSCQPAEKQEKIKSVTVAFLYPGLVGPEIDAKFYTGLAKNYAFSVQSITNFEGQKISKNQFLQDLKQATQDVKTINFNYAGHGLINEKGEFSIVLPGAPKGCFAASPNYRGLARIKDDSETPTSVENKECEKYLVSESDLRRVFGGKKIFGFIDSCHSGAIRLGDKANVLYAAGADQLAEESPGRGGKFTQAVRKAIEGHDCRLDFDKDNQLSMEELNTFFPPVWIDLPTNDLSSTQEKQPTRGLGRTDLSVIDGKQTPGQKGFGDWLSCVAIAGVSSTCTNAISDKGAFEVATQREDVILNRDNKEVICRLKKGDEVQILSRSAEVAYVELPSSRSCPRERGYVSTRSLQKISGTESGVPRKASPDRSGVR